MRLMRIVKWSCIVHIHANKSFLLERVCAIATHMNYQSVCVGRSARAYLAGCSCMRSLCSLTLCAVVFFFAKDSTTHALVAFSPKPVHAWCVCGRVCSVIITYNCFCELYRTLRASDVCMCFNCHHREQPRLSRGCTAFLCVGVCLWHTHQSNLCTTSALSINVDFACKRRTPRVFNIQP